MDVRSSFDIGSVLARTVAAIKDSPGLYLLLGLVLYAAPMAGFQIYLAAGPGVSKLEPAVQDVIVAVASALIAPLLQGAVLAAALTYNEGGALTRAQCFSAARANYLPLLGISLLYGLAVGLGLLLFVIPGLIIATIWLLAAPAQIAWRPAGQNAFDRSAELTAGRRWPLFGMMAVFVIGFVIVASAGVAAMVLLEAVAGRLFANIAYSLAVETGLNVLFNVLLVSTFVQLTLAKEGPPSRLVAEVFA
ncbi:MAG TPA: hypothetical protein VEC60_17185 [Reyranella sp.]|nr:hypothetical protein [Reyranella sp.]